MSKVRHKFHFSFVPTKYNPVTLTSPAQAEGFHALEVYHNIFLPIINFYFLFGRRKISPGKNILKSNCIYTLHTHAYLSSLY